MRESKFKSYNDLPLTLNALDVAEVLGISRAAAYELVRSKGFPHMNIGKRILIPKDAFLEWIREQTEVNDRKSIVRQAKSSSVCRIRSLMFP